MPTTRVATGARSGPAIDHASFPDTAEPLAHTATSTPASTPASTAAGSGGLASVFNVLNLGNLLAALGCPLAKALPSPPVPSQLRSVLCALGVLNYAYRTVYIEPDGTRLTRITPALVGLPTLIDANGGGLPDFIGTLLPALGAGATLDITRLPTLPVTARVSVEAVLLDPAAPQGYLGIGEDGTAAGTASNWMATLQLVSDSTAGTELSLSEQNSGELPSSVALLGELFSGANPDAPTSDSLGDISFSPVPASLTADITLGDSTQQVNVTSSASSLVQAALRLITPGEEQDVDASIDNMPKSFGVTYTHPSGQTELTYTADAAVSHLSVDYRDLVDGAIATAAALDATDLPTGVKVNQAGSTTAVSTTGGPIGDVEVRYGSGVDVPAPGSGTGAYASYSNGVVVSGPTFVNEQTAAVRIPNLTSLTLNAAAPFSADLQMSSPLTGLAVSASEPLNGISVTGTLSNLPAHTTVGFDTVGGVITFDGHGYGINEIDLHASIGGLDTYQSPITRVDLTVDDIPASETLDYSTANGTVTATASAPIGQISLLASNGGSAPPVSGSNATFDDIPGSTYLAFVRIDGLSAVTLSTSPYSGSITTAEPQLLTVDVQLGRQTYDGTIDELPTNVSFSLTPGADGAETVDYQASAPIAHVGLIASEISLPKVLSKAEGIDVGLAGIPSHVTLSLPGTDAGQVTLDPHGGYIGQVNISTFGTGTPLIYPPPGQQEAYFNEIDSDLLILLTHAGEFSMTQNAEPVSMSYDISSAPLNYYFLGTDGTYSDGVVSNPEPASITLDGADQYGDVTMQYHVNPASPNFTGDGSIGQIGITTNAGGGYLTGTLQNLPANVTMCLQDKAEGACQPAWTPASVCTDPHCILPSATFALELYPTDLNGNAPSTPVVLNGRYCPQTTLPANCTTYSGDPIVTIDSLSFTTVEAAYADHDDSCTTGCGRAWFGLNSNGQHITGDVAWYPKGDYGYRDPEVELKVLSSGTYLAPRDAVVFAHYHLPTGELFQSGTFGCSSPPPHLQLNVIGIGADLFDGSVIHLCHP